MKKAKYLTLVLIALLVATSVLSTGCSIGKKPVVLRLNAVSEPVSLDPATTTAGTEIRIINQAYNGLLTQDQTGKLLPVLADSWKVSDDGKTYTFTLKKGVKFQNGREVTADDFVWSITRALAKDTKSSTAMLYLGDIVGAKDLNDGKTDKLAGLSAKDKYTLEFKIDAPKSYFPAKLTYPTAYVLAKEEVQKGANWVEGNKAGAGPYILEKWTHKDKVVMKAWDGFYAGKAKIPEIDWLMVTDENTALLMYKNGELDVVDVPALEYKKIKADATLSKELVEQGQSYVSYLALNQGAYAPFKNVKVRQAFAMAVDKAALVKVLYDDTKKVAQSFVPPGIPGFDPSFKGLPFDPAKAKQLLADAGYKDPSKMPKLVITYNTRSATAPKEAQFYQAQWQQNLGVPIDLLGKEGGAYTNDVFAGNVIHVFIGGWGADYLDPQNFLSGLFASTSTRSKRVGYSSKAFDDVALKADVEKDQAKRLTMYQQADKILVDDDAAVVPIYYNQWMYLVKPYVKGYQRSAIEVMPLNNATIDKSSK